MHKMELWCLKLEFCHVKLVKTVGCDPCNISSVRSGHRSLKTFNHDQAHIAHPNTKKELSGGRMGNANSQLLDNIVQGSNCIFINATAVKPALTPNSSRS